MLYELFEEAQALLQHEQAHWWMLAGTLASLWIAALFYFIRPHYDEPGKRGLGEVSCMEFILG